MNRIGDILRQCGVSDRLSAVTGISVERLRQIEQGASATVGEAERIAKALKIDVRELASASTKADKIDFFFRDAQHKSDYAVATKLSSRVASSLKLLPDRQIA